MATVTRAPRPETKPTPAEQKPAAPEAHVLDPMVPYRGDRIAFGIWITCALFMAALLTYDSVMGLFR
jgi:hypothetical protein